jgi:2-oxoglutarate dehydrogenase E2 component (dihydrolipoamide succinyltransferase)
MPRVKVLLPQWGMGMSEGTVTKWYKNIGDEIKEEEAIASAEAEKAEDDILSPTSGKLVEILVEEGETVPVRTPVAIVEI